MATRLTFEKRVEDAKGYVEKGEIKKAVSTLKKAILNEPKKDVDKKIELLIAGLEDQLKVVKTEEVTKPFVLSFTDRVENAKEFIADGKSDRAIATLKIAVEENPQAENIKDIELWIAELEKKPEETESTEEEVIPGTKLNPTDDITEENETEVETIEETTEPKEEEEKEVTAEDLEVITFRVTAPFMRNCVPFEVGDIINLPRKNDQLNIEPVE